jgi:NAD(P)-dependent dehydrogenase (short-subunit alcohol dehydrogenase family)
MFLVTKAVCSEWVGIAKEKASVEAERKPDPDFYLQRKVVNISSIVGKGGNIGQANYASSKAGVVGFTKTVAREMARYNIRANAVLPGFIATEMTEGIPEKVMESFLARIPLKRKGTPEDIAGTAAFLSSDNSSYITGTTIEVTGGFGM